jgi:hypothetical protein
MPEKFFACVVMSSEIQEERIRGIEYSKEPHRFRPGDNDVMLFEGDRQVHELTQDKSGKWRCNCYAFRRLHQLANCRHVIAAERICERHTISLQWPPTAQPVISQSSC